MDSSFRRDDYVRTTEGHEGHVDGTYFDRDDHEVVVVDTGKKFSVVYADHCELVQDSIVIRATGCRPAIEHLKSLSTLRLPGGEITLEVLED